MKRGLILIAFLFAVLTVGSAAWAGEHPGHEHPGMEQESSRWTMHGFYAGVDLNAFIPFNDDLDTSLLVSGNFGYQWNEYLSVELELGWAEVDFSGIPGDVTTVPLLVNARWNIFPGVYVVDPYVFGGIGVAFNDIDVPIPGADIDNSFAGQIGGGVDYHITEVLSAYLEAAFYFNAPDVNVPVAGEEDVELNAFRIGGGIKFTF